MTQEAPRPSPLALSWTRRVLPAALFQASLVGGLALLKPAVTALTLTRFAIGALPWLYLSAAFLTGLLAFWNVRSGTRRQSPGRLMLLGAGATAALLVALRAGHGPAALAAYLVAELLGTWVAVTFWAQLNEAFDAREARRAFTLINGIGMGGGILGGLSAQVFAPTLGAVGLAWAGAAVLGAGSLAWSQHRSAMEPSSERPRPLTALGWGEFKGARYVQVLGLLVLAFSLLSALSDYLFRHRAHALSEAEMAGLFGSVQLWTGVFAVVFQLFLAEWLLRTLGILRYLALVPLSFAALGAATGLLPTLWPAYLLKLLEGAAAYSLLPVGIQLLYAPLPDERRDGVRAVIDGFLRKGGLAVGAVLLLAFGTLADGTQLSWAIVLFGLFAAFLIAAMRQGYLEALHARVGGASDDGLPGLEVRLLFDALKSPSPERALRAVEMLQLAHVPLSPHVRTLLAHPHERVQERGVKLAVVLQVRNVSRELEALIARGERRPRYEATWALARLDGQRALQTLPPLLSAQDVGVRCAATGALRLLGFGPAGAALEQMVRRGASAAPAERREVARLLGRLADPRWADTLVRYLSDGDATVRRVAIAAVGEGQYLAVAPRLLRLLGWREDRRAAREALTMLGDAAVELLAQVLDDRTRALSLRLQVPRVLRQIGTQRAFDALLFSNPNDDAFLHHQIGTALIRLRDARPDLSVDRPRLLAALERRREVYRALALPFTTARAAVGDRSLLTRALGDRLDQAFELTFWLLGLLHEPRLMRRAHAHLVGQDARRRAWALELLEAELLEDVAELVRAQVHAHHRALPPSGAERFGEVLAALCTSEDQRLRACARQLARARGEWPDEWKGDDMSEATVRRLFALEGVEIFSQCDVDDLAAIAQVAREQSFGPGDRVYSEGDPGDALYVVLEGRAEARRDGELVMELKEKEAFGDVSLFDGSPRVTDMVAVKPLKVLVIDRRDFLDLLADRPELLAGVFRVMSRQFKTMVIELAEARNTGEIPVVGPPVP